MKKTILIVASLFLASSAFAFDSGSAADLLSHMSRHDRAIAKQAVNMVHFYSSPENASIPGAKQQIDKNLQVIETMLNDVGYFERSAIFVAYEGQYQDALKALSKAKAGNQAGKADVVHSIAKSYKAPIDQAGI